MLTKEDIQEIKNTTLEAAKEIFVTKEEFGELKEDFKKHVSFVQKNLVTREEIKELESRLASKEDINKVITVVDAYAKQSKDFYQEVTVAVGRVNRIEKYLRDEVAPKIGVRYE